MGTITGSGASKRPDARAAGKEAALRAAVHLGGAAPTFGFVFASPRRPLASALAGAREVAGRVEITGCTTAGEITEQGLIHDGVAVMLAASDTTATRACLATGMKERAGRVADELARVAEDLRRSSDRAC